MRLKGQDTQRNRKIKGAHSILISNTLMDEITDLFYSTKDNQ